MKHNTIYSGTRITKDQIMMINKKLRKKKMVYLRTIKGLKKGQSVQKKLMDLTTLENSKILEKTIPETFSKEDEVLVIHMKDSLYSKEMRRYMESFTKYYDQKGINALFVFDLDANDIKVTKENREDLIRVFEYHLKRLKNEKDDFTIPIQKTVHGIGWNEKEEFEIHINDDGGTE